MADEFILRNQFSCSGKNSKSPVVTISLQEHHLPPLLPLSGYVYTHTHRDAHIFVYIKFRYYFVSEPFESKLQGDGALPLEGDATVFSQSKDILLHNDPN